MDRHSAGQEWLQFLVELVEKTQDPEELLFRLLMPQLMRYCSKFPKNELIVRKLSFHCARKIITLVLETEAYAANSDPSNPENKDKVLMLPGTTEPLPPTFAGLLELHRDRDYCRVIIMTLSAVIMQVRYISHLEKIFRNISRQKKIFFVGLHGLPHGDGVALLV